MVAVRTGKLDRRARTEDCAGGADGCQATATSPQDVEGGASQGVRAAASISSSVKEPLTRWRSRPDRTGAVPVNRPADAEVDDEATGGKVRARVLDEARRR